MFAGLVQGFKGTPEYMAPEEVLPVFAAMKQVWSGQPPQAQLKFNGRAADLWSLGVVAYQWFTSRVPFPCLMTMEEQNMESQKPLCEQLQNSYQAYTQWQVSHFTLPKLSGH